MMILLTPIVITVFSALGSVGASPQPRIVGGSFTSVEAYPFSAALLYSNDLVFYKQMCGSTIITNTVVLTAAACVYGDSTNRWRIRLGSTYANSGGYVYSVAQLGVHFAYNPQTLDSDVAIVRSSIQFTFSNTVRSAVIAASGYYVADDQPVWAIGWGTTSNGGIAYETLRHVQAWAVNQAVCRNNYATIGFTVTDNMLCSGWLNVGGRGQCAGDGGSPVLHNNVVVGITSAGYGCGLPSFPTVSTRVSSFTTWLQNNA